MTPLSTVLVPWDGENEAWLQDCLNSFPVGTPYVVAKNNGKLEMAPALNACLATIDTEYVFVCGADDLAGPGMLETLEAAIGDADGAYPRMELFGEREWTFHPPLWSPHVFQWRNTCGVFLARTEVLKAVGGWRNAVVEDWDLMNRIAKAGYRFERVVSAEYRYRQHADSLTQRIERVARDEEFSQEQQMREILGDKMERYPLEAVFFGQASPAQNYVRGQVPSEHLPGVASDAIWQHNLGASAAIWLYPGKGAYDLAFHDSEYKDLFDLTILDTDDNYVSPTMIRSFERAGRDELARFWRVEQPFHERFAVEADAVFCATPSLAESYSKLNANVHVLRNGVLEADWRRIRKSEEDGKVRIGWLAGRQHDPDAPIVAGALRSIKRRHGDRVEIVSVGVDTGWDFEHTKLNFTPSLSVYRQLLASFDISLAPLKRTPMNHGKSDLKWLEASMAGAAFVCTDYEPYNTVRHGVTGLKCASRNEWETAIDTLIMEPNTRAGMVADARRVVLETRSAERVAGEYREALARVRGEAMVAA